MTVFLGFRDHAIIIKKKIKPAYYTLLSNLYAINTALECLQDSVGNGAWSKLVSYDLIGRRNEERVEKYYSIEVFRKMKLVKAAREEIEMVRRLIQTSYRKYVSIIESAEKIDIHAIDQACDDVDNIVRNMRKIIINMPNIVQKVNEILIKRQKEIQQRRKRDRYSLLRYR